MASGPVRQGQPASSTCGVLKWSTQQAWRSTGMLLQRAPQARLVPKSPTQLHALDEHPAAAAAPPPVAASVLGAVVIPPAAAELYKAMVDSFQPKDCRCCCGTGFVICSSCQGRGKQGLTLPGEAPSHTPCPTCSKTGRCACSECCGSGLENWWLWQPASGPEAD